jgi:hypothetical protein
MLRRRVKGPVHKPYVGVLKVQFTSQATQEAMTCDVYQEKCPEEKNVSDCLAIFDSTFL